MADDSTWHVNPSAFRSFRSKPIDTRKQRAERKAREAREVEQMGKEDTYSKALGKKLKGQEELRKESDTEITEQMKRASIAKKKKKEFAQREIVDIDDKPQLNGKKSKSIVRTIEDKDLEGTAKGKRRKKKQTVKDIVDALRKGCW